MLLSLLQSIGYHQEQLLGDTGTLHYEMMRDNGGLLGVNACISLEQPPSVERLNGAIWEARISGKVVCVSLPKVKAAVSAWKMPILVRITIIKRRHGLTLILGELFALCPYSTTGSAVEAVLDSSRYFVLKIEHEGLYLPGTTLYE